MREWFSVGRWRGVPVRVHWTLVLWLPFAYTWWRQLLPALLAAAASVLLLLVHELGHAAVAQRRRLHVLAIELQFLHGRCVHEAPDHELDDIWVAWGGVMAQAVLLLVTLAVALPGSLWPAEWRHVFAPLWRVLVFGNLLIIAINLMPFETLDGKTAWRVLPYWRSWWQERSARRTRAKRSSTHRRPTLTVIDSQKAAADVIARAKRRADEEA